MSDTAPATPLMDLMVEDTKAQLLEEYYLWMADSLLNSYLDPATCPVPGKNTDYTGRILGKVNGVREAIVADLVAKLKGMELEPYPEDIEDAARKKVRSDLLAEFARTQVVKTRRKIVRRGAKP